MNAVTLRTSLLTIVAALLAVIAAPARAETECEAIARQAIAAMNTNARQTSLTINRRYTRGVRELERLDREGAADDDLRISAHTTQHALSDIIDRTTQTITELANNAARRLRDLNAPEHLIQDVRNVESQITRNLETQRTESHRSLDDLLYRLLNN